MYYCFIKEDIENLENDPLCIQMKYAEKMKAFCMCSIKEKCVLDRTNQRIFLDGKRVFLRGSYDNIFEAIKILKQQDVELIETEEDILTIENWSKLGLTKRSFYSTTAFEIMNANKSKKLMNYLQNRKNIFLKSKKKGFCAKVNVEKIINADRELEEFLLEKGKMYGEELIITDFLELKTDSLGSKESRHIILDGNLMNSSRRIHSLKHTVPRSHLKKAREIIEQIKQNEDFPLNYVLDIGEFVEAAETYLDIIEINPISSSLCYVNNSIYKESIKEIQETRERLQLGNEYCYDALKNPILYDTLRNVNRNYCYIMEERYGFE